MDTFSFSIPQKIVFGYKSISKIKDIVASEGLTKLFVVSGPNIKRIGLLDKLTQALSGMDVQLTVFTDVEENPSVETVNKATDLFLSSGSNAIVAFGGGSPMDVAKAVGVLGAHGGDIREYEGGGKVPSEIVKMIAIPTTAGTGSEVTSFTVISDKENNYKLTVFSDYLLPAYVILDPEAISTVPAKVAAATGMDAMIHAIEAYLSKASTLASDLFAEKAIALIGQNIRNFVADRENTEAASNMLCASMFAGVAFNYARLGNVHAMSHPLSAFFNTPHGVANAILLPTVLEFNRIADAGKYKVIYELLKGTKEDHFEPSMLISYIKSLLTDLSIPTNLSEIGIDPKKIDAMAIDAMKSGNVKVNPRSTTIEDIKSLYYIAMNQ